MLIQDGYCSPEQGSQKYPAKQTPKPILKESANSDFKPRKELIINEYLNETRKLSQRSESNEPPQARNNKTAGVKGQGKKGQSLRPQTATGTSAGRYDAEISGSQQKNAESGKEIPRAQKEQLTDFQKEYARQLQMERQQEIYRDVMKKSESSPTKESQTDKHIQNEEEEARKSATYEGNRQLLRSLHKSESLDNKSSNRSLGGLSNLDHIEEKIYELEKSLDCYSNKLRQSIVKKRDQLRSGVFQPESATKDERDAPLRSWEEKRSSSVPRRDEAARNKENSRDLQRSQDNFGNERASREKQAVDDYKKAGMKQKDRSVNHDNRSSKPADEVDKFGNELQRLREENQYLKSKIYSQTEGKTSIAEKRDIVNTLVSDNIFEKEMELLKTIERVRVELYNSISKKTMNERKNASAIANSIPKSATKTQKTNTHKMNSNIKTKNNDYHSKDQKVRKAYGETVLERENTCILNQGLSTSYNGFHWNADQSLKICRNI